MTLMAVLGAALVLLICVGLTWSARSGSGGPDARAGASGDHLHADWWPDFERQFRAYAQADGDRSATPRGPGPHSI